MNTQVNIRLPEKTLSKAKKYAEKHGYASIQELMKDSLREKIFEEKDISDEEAVLISKLIEVSERKSLYGTEKDLMKALG